MCGSASTRGNPHRSDPKWTGSRTLKVKSQFLIRWDRVSTGGFSPSRTAAATAIASWSISMVTIVEAAGGGGPLPLARVDRDGMARTDRKRWSKRVQIGETIIQARMVISWLLLNIGANIAGILNGQFDEPNNKLRIGDLNMLQSSGILPPLCCFFGECFKCVSKPW